MLARKPDFSALLRNYSGVLGGISELERYFKTVDVFQNWSGISKLERYFKTGVLFQNWREFFIAIPVILHCMIFMLLYGREKCV